MSPTHKHITKHGSVSICNTVVFTFSDRCVHSSKHIWIGSTLSRTHSMFSYQYTVKSAKHWVSIPMEAQYSC